MDSPLRRSTRLKQSADGSPESVNELSNSQGVRLTRCRAATMEGKSLDMARVLRSTKTSTSSDINEIPESENSQETSKRVTRKSIMSTPSTPKAIRKTRGSRAGSETKSTPPVARITRKTRAISMDLESTNPSNSEPLQSTMVPDAGIRIRRQASILPSEPAVTEEVETNATFPKRLDRTVTEINELGDLDNSSNVSSSKDTTKSLENMSINEERNTSEEKMEVDNFPEVSSTPPQQSPLGSCKVNSSERLIDKLETPESLSLSKNFRTESHEMNVENSNEVSFDKSIKRTLVKASIELGLQIEGLLNSSAEKQLQNDSNKENEKYDVSPVVTATIQEVPTTVMTSNNRKSLSPVLVEKAEQIKQVLSSDQMPSKVSPIKESLTMTSLSANTEGLNDLEDTSPVSDSKADDSIIVIEDTEITEIDKVEKQNDINRASDNLITKEIVIRLNRTKVHRKASSEEMSIFDRDKSKASKDAIMSDDSKDSNPEILEVSHNLENVTSFTDKLLQSEKSNEHENRTSRLMTENNDSPSKWMSPVVENKPHTNIDRNSINKEDVISSKESLEKDISRSADTTLFVEVTASSMNIPVENNFDEGDSLMPSIESSFADLKKSATVTSLTTDDLQTIEGEDKLGVKAKHGMSSTVAESTSGQSKEVSVSEDQSKKVATSVNTEVQHRGAVQKPKSEKNQTRSQKRHDEDDSDSDMNLENLFHDIPANEWNRKFTGSSPTVENESEAECDLVLEDKEETAAEEVTKNGSNSGNTLSFKKSEVKAKKGNETKTGDEEENKEMDVESDVENKVCEETAVRKSLQSNQQLLGLVVDKNVKKSDSFRKSVDNSENDVSSTAYCKSTGKSESTTNVQKDVHSSVDESSKSSLETSTSSKSRSQKKRKSTENSSEKNINVSNDLNNLNTSKASNKSKILESEEDNANFDDEEAVATQTNVSFEKSNKSRKSAENQQVSRQSLNKSNQEHGSSFIAVTKSNNSFNETNSSNSSEKIPTSPISGNKKSSKKREESVKEKARFSVTSTQGEMEPEHMDTDEDEEEEEPWKNSSNNIDIRRSESGASGKRSKRASLVVEEDESLFVSGKQIKAVSQKYGEYNTVNENYSIAAQVDSESSNDSLEDSKEQWVPQFLFGSSNGEEDGSSNGSIDSDIAREYNLDGKSDVEDPDEDIPGDVCRESEVENSDSDDNGSDLEGFVVYDEEEDEEDEDESAEEDTSRGKGKKKFSRIAVQFSDEEEEESDNEVNPKVIKTSVGDESNVLKFTEKLRDNIETVKTPKRGKVPQNLSETDKSRGVSDEQNADKSFKTPKVSSTPKLSGKTLKNKIVSNINLAIKKDESSNHSTSDEKSLSPAFVKKKNKIHQLHTMPSLTSTTSFCETSGTKQKVSDALQKSLPAVPTDLTDVTETNLSRQKSSKVSMLNKTMLTPSSETTVTKFLKKQRLHDTLPSVDLQEQAEGILDEAKEIVESSKEAHLTSKMSTLDKSRKDHIHTRIKEKSNEEDTKILVEQEEMTPTENTTKLKNSEVNKKASKKLKNEQKTIFEAEEAVDKPTKGEKKKKKKKKLSDQGQETENPEKSKTKNNLKAQDKLEATDEAEHVTETMVTKKQKKKKRQSAQMIPTENIEKMDDKPAKKVAEKRKETENLDENSTQRPSKKRKKVESTEFGATSEEKLNSKKLAKDIEVDSGTKQKLKKKSKKSPAEQVEQEAIKMADKDTNKESAGRARKKIKSEGSDLQNSEDQPTTSSKLTSKKKKVRAEIINPEDQPVKISKLTSKKSTATSDSDEAPEAVDFSKARAEALRAMKNAVDSIKAGRETKRKERREQLERIHQKKSAKLEAESAKLESESRPRNSGLKRLPDEVVENLSDSSMKRSKRKRRKLSKTDEMVPPKSLFVPDRASNAANNAEDGFIPLSAAGSTTEFSVVKLTKIKKRTSSTAASFRQQKLARNNRQPSTSYTTYRQKLKASGKDKLPH